MHSLEVINLTVNWRQLSRGCRLIYCNLNVQHQCNTPLLQTLNIPTILPGLTLTTILSNLLFWVPSVWLSPARWCQCPLAEWGVWSKYLPHRRLPLISPLSLSLSLHDGSAEAAHCDPHWYLLLHCYFCFLCRHNYLEVITQLITLFELWRYNQFEFHEEAHRSFQPFNSLVTDNFPNGMTLWVSPPRPPLRARAWWWCGWWPGGGVSVNFRQIIWLLSDVYWGISQLRNSNSAPHVESD